MPTSATGSPGLFADGLPLPEWDKADNINLISIGGEKVPIKSLFQDGKRVVFVMLRKFDCATW